MITKFIGMQLRDLNRQQHTIARTLVSDVIFYAILNKLSEESFVGVSLTPTNNYRGTFKPSYPPFIPSRSSPSKSESHSPVHTLPSQTEYNPRFLHHPHSTLLNLQILPFTP